MWENQKKNAKKLKQKLKQKNKTKLGWAQQKTANKKQRGKTPQKIILNTKKTTRTY